MSLIQPTRELIIGSTNVSDDCLEIHAVDTSLDHSLPNIKIILTNINHKYADLWPAFGETGLYYPGSLKFNGVEIIQFRFEGIDPKKSKGNTIELDGLVVGGTTIQKQYITQDYTLPDMAHKADDVISDIIYWLNSSKLVGRSLVEISYTSNHVGELIYPKYKKEYCHDAIRKILERFNWTATLRGSNATLAALDVFPVADASHRHTTIFTDDQIITSGESPRDIKESPNILEVTGGKSTLEPSTGDTWTEGSVDGGKSNAWHTPSGFGIVGVVRNPVDCGNSALVGFAGNSNFMQDKNGFIFELNLQEALGSYYDAVTRNLQAISFRVACNNDMGTAGFKVRIAVQDSNGTRLAQVLLNGSTGPRKANTYQQTTVPLSPAITSDGKILDFMNWYYEKVGPPDSDGSIRFHWDKLAKIFIYNIITASVGQQGKFKYPMGFYIDCFYISQNWIPEVRVVDSLRSGKYDPRMMSIDAPEYTDYAELKNYALSLVQAAATPTYFADFYVLHDPATELIKAGWQVRFSAPNFGISSSVYWRLLEVHWIWTKAQGLIVRVVGVPAISGSADYSKNLSSRVWTNKEAGEWKNVIDAIHTLRIATEQFSGPTIFTGGGKGFTLSCDPCILNGKFGEGYAWQLKMTVKAISNFTGKVNLSINHNIPSGSAALQDTSLDLSSDYPELSTIVSVTDANITPKGTYTVTVIGVDDATGSIQEQVEISVIIGETGPPPPGCQDDGQCGPGEVCVGGQCLKTCTSDANCPPGCQCVQVVGRPAGVKVCQCNNIILNCYNVEVPEDGTEIGAVVATIQLPDSSWSAIYDWPVDYDGFTLNGDVSFSATTTGTLMTILGKFKNRGWPNCKHFKFRITAAGGQVGTSNFPAALTCWFDVHISNLPTFVIEAMCQNSQTCDVCTSTCGSWGIIASALYCYSYGSECSSATFCGDVYAFHARIYSVNGFDGIVHIVTNNGCHGGVSTFDVTVHPSNDKAHPLSLFSYAPCGCMVSGSGQGVNPCDPACTQNCPVTGTSDSPALTRMAMFTQVNQRKRCT